MSTAHGQAGGHANAEGHGQGYTRRELPDLNDRPTPFLLMLTGLLLGLMFMWLLSTIIYAMPPRYSGLRPEVMLMLLAGAVGGVLVGGFISVILTRRRA